MEISIFIFIILIHFLADFGLQTHQQATLKNSDNKYLFYHVGVYSLVWLISLLSCGIDIITAIEFSFITFVIHYLTDWVTSKIVKPFWEKQDFHNVFVVVGFDQILHYIQLVYTLKLLL